MGKLEKIPIYERPYEKLLLYGESKLSNSELLSIIIKCGTQNLSALEIAQNLISNISNQYNDLRFLQKVSIKELMGFEGIGKIKAIELKAIGEISKRLEAPINSEKLLITSRQNIVNMFMEELRHKEFEIVKLIMLNNKNIIQKITTLAIGNTNGVVLDIKQVLSEPIKLQIPKIIIIHNHPSGNPEPSKKDIEFTHNLDKACKIMGIELLDHIIFGDGIYEIVIRKDND